VKGDRELGRAGWNGGTGNTEHRNTLRERKNGRKKSVIDGFTSKYSGSATARTETNERKHSQNEESNKETWKKEKMIEKVGEEVGGENIRRIREEIYIFCKHPNETTTGHAAAKRDSFSLSLSSFQSNSKNLEEYSPCLKSPGVSFPGGQN